MQQPNKKSRIDLLDNEFNEEMQPKRANGEVILTQEVSLHKAGANIPLGPQHRCRRGMHAGIGAKTFRYLFLNCFFIFLHDANNIPLSQTMCSFFKPL